jgi:hypothetical protein
MHTQGGFLRLLGIIAIGALLVVGLFFYTPIGAFSLAGESESRTFDDLEAFTEVRLRGSGTIKIQRGTSPSVTISSDQNIIDKFTVTTEDDILILSMNELDLIRSLKLDPETTTISLTLPEIDALHLSGSYQLDSAVLEGGELTLTTQGKTAGDLSLTSNTLTIHTSGHNELTLTGSAFTETTFILNSTGTVDAAGLSTPKADVSARGSGTLRLNNPADASLELTGTSKVFFESLPRERFRARALGQSIIGLYDPEAANTEPTNDSN